MKKSNASLIAAARKNPTPAIRNVLRPVAESVKDVIKNNPPSPVQKLPEVNLIRPNDEDLLVKVRVLRSGTYYPGRMQSETKWEELEITTVDSVVRCWKGDIWGHEGDYCWLDMKCGDLDEVEWDSESDSHIYDYKMVTPKREFRHVADMLKELEAEGSVTIR